MHDSNISGHLALAPYRLDFAGRCVLLTGASRGIAAALARALALAGAHVSIHYSQRADADAGHPHAARELLEELVACGASGNLIECDLTQPLAGARLAEQARAVRQIDSVVLSASRQIHRPLLQQSSEQISEQFGINLHANIELLQGLLPDMMSAGFGRVLSIGSVQETTPSPEMPIYAMCKSALRNLIENLAVQMGSFGITANNISPGLVETDRNAFRRVDMEHWLTLARNSSAVGRAGKPEDLIAPAMMLLSREAAFVTGATLHATGGAHIARYSNDPGRARSDATEAQPGSK